MAQKREMEGAQNNDIARLGPAGMQGAPQPSLWLTECEFLGIANRTNSQLYVGIAQGSRYLLGQRFCVLCFEICIPFLLSPCPL